MPWCPKCRNEYREGFKVCADCGVELVDVLGDEVVEKEVFFTVPKFEADRILEYLEASDIKDIDVEENEDGNANLLVDPKKRKETMFALRTYLEKRKEEQEAFLAAQGAPEEARVLSEDDEVRDEAKKPETVGKAYVSSKTKADDAKNSAIALLIIGLAGLIFEALVVFHVLPITINGVSGIAIYSFMGIVFLGLIIAAMFSFATAKRLRPVVTEEDDLTGDILKFCREEVVDYAKKMIPDTGEAGDESIYFARMDFLKTAIKSDPRFSHIELSVIDGLLDENYHQLFS